MAKNLVDIHGKVKYIHAVNMSQFNKWSITIEPDAKSLEVVKGWIAEGLKNELKKNEANEYYISFHRDPEKTMRGKKVAFAAPRVIDRDGKIFDGSLIGRGSDVTCRLDVYRSTPQSPYKYIAARWDSLRVDELVPWESTRDLSPEEAGKVESLKHAQEAVDPW